MASTTIETQAPLTNLTTTGVERNDVNTTLNFYFDDGKPPAPAYINRPETHTRPQDTRPVTIRDLRGREAEYSLDKQGLQFVKHTSKESSAGFDDDEHIKKVYYPEVEQLIKDVTGASKVYIFDHTVRRPQPSTPAKEVDPNKPITRRGPVQSVHIDQSYSASRNRITHHFPGVEGERLLTRHSAIINIWRPIKKILKDPLGFADARSVQESDLVPIGLIYPDRKGETLSVRYNKGQEWLYLHGQDVDEVTLIKCYDSKDDGRARRIPHSAFVDPKYEGEVGRESIEVRTLVFWEDEEAE